jgi:hypothetical protein
MQAACAVNHNASGARGSVVAAVAGARVFPLAGGGTERARDGLPAGLLRLGSSAAMTAMPDGTVALADADSNPLLIRLDGGRYGFGFSMSATCAGSVRESGARALHPLGRALHRLDGRPASVPAPLPAGAGRARGRRARRAELAPIKPGIASPRRSLDYAIVMECTLETWWAP